MKAEMVEDMYSICRAIHNPGRYEPYKQLTGRDEPVIRFLEDNGEIFHFLEIPMRWWMHMWNGI